MKRCPCKTCRLYRGGLGLKPVAGEVGLSGEGVRQRLLSHGTPVRPPTGRQRFMPDDRTLRQLHKLDVPKVKIAELTGISMHIIHRRVRELGLHFRRRGRATTLQG